MGIWRWLNGRKTAIGLLIEVLTQAVQHVPALVEGFGGDAAAAAQVVGRALLVLGTLHKIVKGA